MRRRNVQAGIILLLAGLFALGSHAVNAQQPLAATDKTLEAVIRLPFPIVPMLIEYEHAPEYFAQWISTSPQYSMIEAVNIQKAPPSYQLVLTDKASGERVYYSSSEAKVKSLTGSGKKAVLTPVDFKVIENVAEQPTYAFAFKDEKGQAIRWRFMPHSAPSDRGSGSTPGRRQGLSVVFRNLSSVADENTAVEIGEKVFPADPWPQISTPPYFVAYRGVYGLGVQTGTIGVGTENWRVTSAPAELNQGAQWVLTDGRNNVRTLQITARSGDELTISEAKVQAPFSTPLTLTALITPLGLALRSIRIENDGHSMSITFKPELNIAAAPSGQSNPEVAFQIGVDKTEKVIEGTISLERSGNATNFRWTPRSPDWAKGRTLNTSLEVDATGYKLVTK